jgi:hypothetical protein
LIVESAENRILRILALSIGIGAVVFTLLGLPAIIAQHRYMSPVYSTAAYVLYCALPVGVAIVSFIVPVRVIRILAAVHAASGVAVIAFWIPAQLHGALPGSPEPWVMGIITLGMCSAALVLGYLPSWIFMLGLAAGAGTMRFFAFGANANPSRAFEDALMIAVYSAIMVSLIQLALRAGRVQDAVALAARDATADAAAADILERQRTKYHAFTHDDVLATLNSASRDTPGTALLTRNSAQRAIAKLDAFRIDDGDNPQVSASELEPLLGTAARIAGVEMEPARMSRGSHTLRIPAEAGEALVEAVGEAVRNSVRHADWPDGRPVTRYVHCVFSAMGVEIIVADDGRGFASRSIAPDRLGVRLSILQRVNAQPGGIATVKSARGLGTTVTLTWAVAEVPA